jgi:hypothetical protein
MQVVNVSVYGGVEKAKKKGVIYCGRPSTLGNPYPLKNEADRAAVLEQYREWLLFMVADNDEPVMDALRELNEDSVLGCWCKPHHVATGLCHCEIIIEVWKDLKARSVI